MVIRRNRENAASLSPRSCIIPKPKKESEKKSTIGRTIRNYGLNATPHGLFYIADDGRPHFERMIWIVITTLAILFTGMQTMQLYTDWKDDPVVTSLDTVALPIENIEFPAVTICPQGSIKDFLDSVLFKQFKEYIQVKTKGDMLLSDLTKDEMLTYAELFLNETYPGAEEMPTKMIQAMSSTDPEKSVQSATLLNQEEEIECDPDSNDVILEVLNKNLKHDSCPNDFEMLQNDSCVHTSKFKMTFDQALGYCDEMQGSTLIILEKLEDLKALDAYDFKIPQEMSVSTKSVTTTTVTAVTNTSPATKKTYTSTNSDFTTPTFSSSTTSAKNPSTTSEFDLQESCDEFDGVADSTGKTCCAKICGKCGGAGCKDRPGGKESCCTKYISKTQICGESVGPWGRMPAPCHLKNQQDTDTPTTTITTTDFSPISSTKPTTTVILTSSTPETTVKTETTTSETTTTPTTTSVNVMSTSRMLACGFHKAFSMKSAKTGKYCCLNSEKKNIKVVKCDDNCKHGRRFYALSNNEDVLINKGADSNPQDRCALWSWSHRTYFSVGMSGGNFLSKNGEQKLKPDDNRMLFQATNIGNKVRIKNMGGQKCLQLQSNNQIKPMECSVMAKCSNCESWEFELEPEDSFKGHSYTSLGCWKDKYDLKGSAIPAREGSIGLQRCFAIALKKGYKVFALQGGNKCYTSARAHLTYLKYGRSDKCKEDGRGGESASEVYKIVEGPGDCSCDTFVDENGLGNCEKDFRRKGVICYVKEPTTCSDIQRTLNGISKGKKYSWEACKAAKRKKREVTWQYSKCNCNGKKLVDSKDTYPDYESCKKKCKDTKGCKFFGVWNDSSRLKYCRGWDSCDKCKVASHYNQVYELESVFSKQTFWIPRSHGFDNLRQNFGETQDMAKLISIIGDTFADDNNKGKCFSITRNTMQSSTKVEKIENWHESTPFKLELSSCSDKHYAMCKIDRRDQEMVVDSPPKFPCLKTLRAKRNTNYEPCVDDPNWIDSKYGDGKSSCKEMSTDSCQNLFRYSFEARKACPKSCKQCVTGNRIRLPKQVMCASLKNVPCSKCSEHIDGRSKYNDENGKCVWIPDDRTCKTKGWVEKGKKKEFVEFCEEAVTKVSSSTTSTTNDIDQNISVSMDTSTNKLQFSTTQDTLLIDESRVTVMEVESKLSTRLQSISSTSNSSNQKTSGSLFTTSPAKASSTQKPSMKDIATNSIPTDKSFSTTITEFSPTSTAKSTQTEASTTSTQEYEPNVDSEPENIKQLGITLDPAKSEERERQTNDSIETYNKNFGSLDMKDSYLPLFELLWYAQMPCVDIKGITSERKDEISFIKRCFWKGDPISCNAIFQKRPTDRGMCCSFNIESAENVLKRSKYTEAISLRQKEEKYLGFEAEEPPKEYRNNEEPKPEAGRNKGLTLVVDRHSDKISPSTVIDNFQGFITIIDDKSKYPKTSVSSLIARPGFETNMEVNAMRVISNKEIRKYEPKKRNCYFPDEFLLDMHLSYSQSNCLLECRVKFAFECMKTCMKHGQECNCQNITIAQDSSDIVQESCIPWFYPVPDDKISQMCSPWNTKKFQQIIDKRIPKDECEYCLPDCTTTVYSTSTSYAKFQKCDHTNMGTNMLCDMIDGDLSPAPWTLLAQKEFLGANQSVPSYLETNFNVTQPTAFKFPDQRKRVKSSIIAKNLMFQTDLKNNPTYNAYEEDIGIINIFFGNAHVTQFAKKNRMTEVGFLSQVGGSVGLAMGISMVSVIEIIYWFTVRLFNDLRRDKQKEEK